MTKKGETKKASFEVLELIDKISNIEAIKGMPDEFLEFTKGKTISSLCAYGKEQIKNPNLWKYPVVSTPDFGAYFRYDMDEEKIFLVFRQETATNRLHSYFKTPEEMVQAMGHLFGHEMNDIIEERNSKKM